MELATLAALILALAAPHAHHRHRHRPMRTATASYYDDAGATACGFHAVYGFAHLGPGEAAGTQMGGLPCGARVRLCAVRCVTATMDDHGPYVAGREFDLDEALKDAIGASDLGSVRYRLVR